MRQKAKYHPAKDLEELARNFNAIEVLTRDLDIFYVPIYEENIKLLRQTLKLSFRPDDLILITGQQGTGKTTALQRVPNNDLEQKFHFIHIQAGMKMNLDDLDIIELLLFIGFEIVDKHKKLENRYYETLDKIQGLWDGSYQEATQRDTNVKVEGGAQIEANQKLKFFSFLNLKAKIFGSIKMDKEFRKYIRKNFTMKKSELINLINDIILEYEDFIGKKLVLIIDDLEKMKDPEQMKELFINNIDVLKNIRCRKILTYPIHLTFEPELTNINKFRFVMRINIPPGHKEDTIAEKNKDLLRQVAYKRMANYRLFEENAIEMAVEFSGGIIRQYINLLWMATIFRINKENKNATIKEEDVLEAIKWWKREMSSAVIGQNIKLLDQIAKTHRPPEQISDAFIKAIIGNQILVYFNDQTWYDINPIIRDVPHKYLNNA